MKRIGIYMLAAILTIQASAGAAYSQTKPKSDARIGVNNEKTLRLTLQDAATMALENNREIEIERQTVQMNEFDLRAADGAYDPIFKSSLFYNRDTQPVASALAGGEDGKLRETDLSSTMSISKKLSKFGGSVQLSFDQNRSTSQNLFNTLAPQFRSSLSFEFVQPLMRNFQIDSDRREIKVAKKRLEISDSQFRRRVIEIISQAQSAYWDLVFARRNQEIKQESVELAREQLENNLRQAAKGILAPSDVVSARLEVERRTDEAESAIEAVQRAENALKSMLLRTGDAENWNAVLMPVDKAEIALTDLPSFDEALKLALLNRPELDQSRLSGELNKIDVEFFRNQTKPQLDLVAGYGTSGLAGTERGEVNRIAEGYSSLFDRVNQLSQLSGLQTLPSIPLNTTPGRLIGGYGQSLESLFRNENRAWRVGVNVSLPFGNRTAKAKLGRALTEGKRIDAQQERMEQTIEIEVRNALQSIETAKKRIEAARNSRIDSQSQLTSERRKFEAGLSTNFFVLDRQNALSAAQGRELKAITDYQKAFIEFQRVVSTTLSSSNITLK